MASPDWATEWTDQNGYMMLGRALADTGRFTRYPDYPRFVPEVKDGANELNMAKDASNRANARVVTLADGRRMSAGSSGGDLPSQ